MSKSRKGLGKKYGKKFVEKQTRDAHIRVYSGSKNTTDKDFDIVFDSLTKKRKK
jgi:hypothetical protein